MYIHIYKNSIPIPSLLDPYPEAFFNHVKAVVVVGRCKKYHKVT